MILKIKPSPKTALKAAPKPDKIIDYRFSLANQRTFLAWIRTALALLAGSVAVDQFIIIPEPANIRTCLAVMLAILGIAISINAFFYWRTTEKAMREGKPLPYNYLLSIMTIIVAIAAICFIILFFAKA